jgi:hypothetical protein
VEELREHTQRLQLLVRQLEERVARLEGRATQAPGDASGSAPSQVVFRPD